MKRLMIIISLVLLPAAALAETTADQLGPATTQQDTGPSNSTSQLLQPASSATTQSLQSADAIEGGIPQPTNNSDLQAAGNQQTVKDFTDTSPSDTHTLPAATNQSRTWDWVLILVALGTAGALWATEQYQARRQS